MIEFEQDHEIAAQAFPKTNTNPPKCVLFLQHPVKKETVRSLVWALLIAS